MHTNWMFFKCFIVFFSYFVIVKPKQLNGILLYVTKKTNKNHARVNYQILWIKTLKPLSPTKFHHGTIIQTGITCKKIPL